MTITDIMVDLETLGTSLSCPILQLGAVAFNITTGELGPECVYDIKPNLSERPADFKTIQWWMLQSEEARQSVFGEKERWSLEHTLSTFAKWLNQFNDDVSLWSHGATFDLSILTQAYEALGKRPPWNFRMVRDTRTLIALKPDFSPPPADGVKHNALSDARWQAKAMIQLFRELKSERDLGDYRG